MLRLSRFYAYTFLVLLLIAVGVGIGVSVSSIRWSEEDVQQAVVTTLQREAPASFYVTGTLDIYATSTVENTKYLFPAQLGLNLGTTTATVRLPGRAAYGFDVQHLRPEDIAVRGDTVVVTLPTLSIFSVEPNLEAMDVETSVGWARLAARSGRRVAEQAIQNAPAALREQAEAHLRTNRQPLDNTAAALEALLTPVLQAVGLETPQFFFQEATGPVLAPAG